MLYWANPAVRVFRVDNPHTNPFAFWESLIAEVKQQYPERFFLLKPSPGRKSASPGEAGLHAVVPPITCVIHRMSCVNTSQTVSESIERILPSECVAKYARHPARVLQTGGRAAFMTVCWRRCE